MKTLLICHEGSAIDQVVLAGWLAEIGDLVGIVVLRERRKRKIRRLRREFERGGVLGLIDVLAFRTYYRLFLASADRRWEREAVRRFRERGAKALEDVPQLVSHSPNSKEVRRFIEAQAPDLAIARCKTLLARRIFSIPPNGTFVFHPGICPEYRNSHGCFWALVNDDLDRVGMTLLRIDKGVDTGPVYGFFTYDFDEVGESHVVIQARVVLENLDGLGAKLSEIMAGSAQTIDTTGRASASWGQPRLTSYLAWKRRARARNPGA